MTQSPSSTGEPIDPGLLKRALKAFKKRLKLTNLDADSGIGGRKLSTGRSSSIVAVAPPDQYPKAVWDELVRQGKLKASSHGMYELGPLTLH